MKTTGRLALGILMTALGVAGCSAAMPANQIKGELDVHSGWTSGADAQALSALVGTYTAAHPSLTVVNLAESAGPDDLATRMTMNAPPGLIQGEGASLVSSWVAPSARLESLDSFFDERRWRPLLPPVVLEQVSYKGSIYAVPLAVHRINSLFYNAKVFQQQGVQPPTSWSEFFAVAATFKKAGIVPLAIGHTDSAPAWRAVFESFVVARAGAAGFVRLWSGQDAADSPALRGSLEDLTHVVDFVNDDAQVAGWTAACDQVMSGHAAMTIVGDWAKPYFNAHGWRSDTDFGLVPAPGTAGTFVATIDAFALPVGAPNRAAAIGFLKSVGAAEGQNTFNPLKGSTPPRLDALDQASDGTYDAMAQRTIADFKSADLVPSHPVPPAFGTAFDDALVGLTKDKNVDTVMALYSAHRLELQPH